jgi:pyruvate,water dikinase
MNYLVAFAHAERMSPESLGGKALLLARLHQAGFSVPAGFCLPVDAYREFLVGSGLAACIAMELQRKEFAEMRWEELWDVSLRIRNHFMTAAWPQTLREALLADLCRLPQDWDAIAVRSTAPGEDSGQHSFAGLHQSRVMLHGPEEALEAIRTVWASLWSDGALLYRKELGLDPVNSGMAVLIQQMVIGERSGVLFTVAPQDSRQMMVEAVWGLNQALVDGTIEPDRWRLDRIHGEVVDRHHADHRYALQPAAGGAALIPLDTGRQGCSPLDLALCRELFAVGLELEAWLGAPADIEWTVRAGTLYILQVRPITTGRRGESQDDRPWYLSLHRSLPNLERLQAELEQVILPAMHRDAESMAMVDPAALADDLLAEEIGRRRAMLDGWLAVYREKCIPMAHGIRLFGEFYNETMRPNDPHAFMELMQSDELLATARNRQLSAMAGLVRDDPALREHLQRGGGIPESGALRAQYESFRVQFGELAWIAGDALDLPAWLLKLEAAEVDRQLPARRSGSQSSACFDDLPAAESAAARRLLAVARASYALRDNDNIVLGKVRAGLLAVEREARRRLAASDSPLLQAALAGASVDKELFAGRSTGHSSSKGCGGFKAVSRQLVGQPAGPGFASGAARVLLASTDLRDFSAGEVLVCDAIEPNMTFVVPLAAAIVERRGGMLIHGAIIAREYGIPCVTGIAGATEAIHPGDVLAVDGYLGIVTIERGGY